MLRLSLEPYIRVTMIRVVEFSSVTLPGLPFWNVPDAGHVPAPSLFTSLAVALPATGSSSMMAPVEVERIARPVMLSLASP